MSGPAHPRTGKLTAFVIIICRHWDNLSPDFLLTPWCLYHLGRKHLVLPPFPILQVSTKNSSSLRMIQFYHHLPKEGCTQFFFFFVFLVRWNRLVGFPQRTPSQTLECNSAAYTFIWQAREPKFWGNITHYLSHSSGDWDTRKLSLIPNRLVEQNEFIIGSYGFMV